MMKGKFAITTTKSKHEKTRKFVYAQLHKELWGWEKCSSWSLEHPCNFTIFLGSFLQSITEGKVSR